MNLFQEVKDKVTAREAAEFYGIDVKRNGMAKCIFHNDSNPSMKLDRRYHCFGCQADGDVIDFAGKLFGLPPWETTKKLASDFGIENPEAGRAAALPEKTRLKGTENKRNQKSTPETEEEKKERRIRKLERQIRSWIERAEITLLQYMVLLEKWEKEYRPAGPEEEYHPLFCEALAGKTVVRYQLDTLLYGTDADRLDFSRRKERG